MRPFFLGQDGGIGDHGAVGNHQEHHVEHEGQSRGIDGVPQGELFPLYLGVLDAAAGHADEGCHRDAEDGEERGLAAEVVLHLNAHIGAHGHADGDGEGKAADALGDLVHRQHIAGQSHGGRAAHRVDGAHVEPHHDQQPEHRKGDEGREGQAEQGQKNQVYPVAVEVIQQIAGHGAEQNGGHRHGGEHDADFGAGDADFLAVYRDDGDGRVKRRQNQKIGDEQQNEFPVPDSGRSFHINKAPFSVLQHKK